MSSIFYIARNKFRSVKTEEWRETAYSAISPGGGWDDAEEFQKFIDCPTD
jgi:hypothetical protein